jgi:uncharacterized caspase-like protein
MKTNFRLIGIVALVSLFAACNQSSIKQSSHVQSRMAGEETTVGLMSPSRFQQPDKGLLRTEKRYALVIGNANYVGDPNIKELRNPINDASDMAKTLKEVAGFNDVMLKINLPNREAMENAVHQFSLKLEKGGVGLFYYAGHGIQADGENYLIPTKVSIPTQVELKHRAMPAKFVLDKMEYFRNDELNIIILDACRNNPLPARGREVLKSGLAEMPNPAGSILIFSTAPGKGAYDGDGRNGVFTKHLLKGIKKYGHKDIEQMLKMVRRAVDSETHDEPVSQLPWHNSSLKRDFCFSPSGCFDPELEEARRQAELEKYRADQARREAEQRAKARLKAKEQAEEEARRLADKAEKTKIELEEVKRQAKLEKERAERAKAELDAKKRAEEKARRLAEEAEKTRRELEEARRQVQIEKERAEKARREAERAQAKVENQQQSVQMNEAAMLEAKKRAEEKAKRLADEAEKTKRELEKAKRQAQFQKERAEKVEEERKQLEAQRKAEAKRKLAERQAIEAERRRIEAERQQPTSAPARVDVPPPVTIIPAL